MEDTLGNDRLPLRQLSSELSSLEQHLHAVERRLSPLIDRVHPTQRESARNLAHYLALRQHELREVQIALQERGLSSLGRSESFVLGSMLEVLLRITEALCLAGEGAPEALEALRKRRAATLDWRTGKFLLHRNTRELLGPRPADRHVSIMVTAPDADTADVAWCKALLESGMNVLRINCAHEGPDAWARVVGALERARDETGAPCRILMDLAGPKIRTGPVDPAVRVLAPRVERDEVGRLVERARVELRALSSAPHEGVPAVLIEELLLSELRVGDRIVLRDARGKKCKLRVEHVGPGVATATCKRRCYFVDGLRADVRRKKRRVGRFEVRIGGEVDAYLPLSVGDELLVTGRDVIGRGPTLDESGQHVAPALVSCTLPKALDAVEVGHRVFFDDGKLEGVVERREGADLCVRIRGTRGPVAKLRAERGINFPDTDLEVDGFTDVDRSHLPFVVRHADIIGVSFVRGPEVIRAVHEALDALGRDDVGVTAKIETRSGFERLPHILLEGMRRPPFGIMIARGDLAVEAGFERLAEVQEEILWLCEASHVPAIWATQVLDNLARTGIPSRAEVTDAAQSVGAECVMLNKGPHIEKAVEVLANIIRRMEQHRYKKRSIFRRLQVSMLEEPT